MYQRIKIMENENFSVYLAKDFHLKKDNLFYILYDKGKQKDIHSIRLYKSIVSYSVDYEVNLNNKNEVENFVSKTERFIYAMLREVFFQQYADKIWDELCMLDLHKQSIETINEEELCYVEI